MKAAVLLLCVSVTFLAQTPSAPKTQSQRNRELREHALTALHAEQARAQQQPCTGQAANEECFTKQAELSQGNYFKMVAALGVLLEVADKNYPDQRPSEPDFEQAEGTWIRYRVQACAAAGLAYGRGGGSKTIEMGCRVSLTRHHMDELWVMYMDFGTA